MDHLHGPMFFFWQSYTVPYSIYEYMESVAKLGLEEDPDEEELEEEEEEEVVEEKEQKEENKEESKGDNEKDGDDKGKFLYAIRYATPS